MGLLQTDESDRRLVVVGGPAGEVQVGRGQGAVVVVDGMDLDPGVASRRPVLVDDEVLATTGDDERAGGAEDTEGELVGHDARGDVDGRRLSHPEGVGLLQGAHGGVLAVAVVADLGLGHGPAHLGGGLGHRVTAEIDEARRHGSGC
jgi:hypothetical protein